jgi:cardiolipin synthase
LRLPKSLKRLIAIALSLPVLLLLAQVGHRWFDTIGAAPVRRVRVLGSPRTPLVAGAPDFVRTMTALTGTPIVPGHGIELLTDGAPTFERMAADIRSARRTIAIQTYYCEPGRVADGLHALLRAKAREGIAVFFLRDGLGCRSLSDAYLDGLRVDGVLVGTVRPLHWYTFHRAQHRSHVRAAVIDGEVAYTGGFGVADKWLPGPAGEPGWRETTVRFTGPAVAQLAGAFAIAWAEATGELLAGAGAFPAPPAAPTDGVVAGVLYTTRSYGTPTPERYLALSLAGARRTVYITNPYFIPNYALRRWLKAAAARGVDVRVLTASGRVDVKLTRWASRSHYADLLAAGVRIYEYGPAMLHAKTMIVDGVWGSVGSLNLDNVSLRLNDEVTFVIRDGEVGAALDSIFRADLEHSDEIVLERFRRRPWTERLRELGARVFRDFL